MAAIADNLEELGKTDSADFLRNELDNQIKLCLVDVMKASNHVLRKGHGYFDLLGCDFMMSASNKLSLLEINTNPSLTLGMYSFLLIIVPPWHLCRRTENIHKCQIMNSSI